MAARWYQTREKVGEAIHRTPPRLQRVRTKGGKWTKVRHPAGTKTVPILAMVLVDDGKNYRGRIGPRERARAARRLSNG